MQNKLQETHISNIHGLHKGENNVIKSGGGLLVPSRVKTQIFDPHP